MVHDFKKFWADLEALTTKPELQQVKREYFQMYTMTCWNYLWKSLLYYLILSTFFVFGGFEINYWRSCIFEFHKWFIFTFLSFKSIPCHRWHHFIILLISKSREEAAGIGGKLWSSLHLVSSIRNSQILTKERESANGLKQINNHSKPWKGVASCRTAYRMDTAPIAHSSYLGSRTEIH